MDIRRVVGRNLKRLRLERGLSQEAPAHGAKSAPSFLSQIENGKQNPAVTKLYDLAKTLRVSVVEFFADVRLAPTKGGPRGRRSR